MDGTLTEAQRLVDNTMALKHTRLWLTIVGWVDVADIGNDKVFETKPSHSHPPHPTTKPHLSLENLSSKPLCVRTPAVPLVFVKTVYCLSDLSLRNGNMLKWNHWRALRVSTMASNAVECLLDKE